MKRHQPCKEVKKEHENSKCEDPEVGMSLANWRKRREAGWLEWGGQG